MELERIFAAIKRKHVPMAAEILSRIESPDRAIIKQKLILPTLENMRELYIEHEGRFYCKRMVKYQAQHAYHIMIIEGYDIVTNMRTLFGDTDPSKALPGTIRRDFGDGESLDLSKLEKRATDNVVHSSDSLEAGLREIAIFNHYFT